jgi:hypothetical protein
MRQCTIIHMYIPKNYSYKTRNIGAVTSRSDEIP